MEYKIMISRIFLFVLTNVLVLAVINLNLKIFGIDNYLAENGIDYKNLLMYSLVVGFTGAFISLFISKWVAKFTTKAVVIKNPSTITETWLYETVRKQSAVAGISMPEVAIYPSNDVNAFATGYSRNSSLVAVSSGLLNNLSRNEAEAVIGHEITHVANGDMVTMALLQGVMNTFVVFLSRVIGYFIDKVIFRNESKELGFGYMATVFVLDILLGILASIVLAAFSRRREYKADRGGANLTTKNDMIAALRALGRIHNPNAALPEGFKYSGINSSAIKGLFSTHPSIEDRIARLNDNDFIGLDSQRRPATPIQHSILAT
jgi:heat shock protein HtpX